MIKKIISGGQTGADRAALDAAIKWQIPHGGWIPKGRKTETGPLPNKYLLKEMPTENSPKRTEQNVIDSDGTLILSHGELTGGSAYTSEMAIKHDRPWLHIDLNTTNKFNAAKEIYSWIKQQRIKTLNVAGSRFSKDPYIYQDTMELLVTVFHMDLIESDMPDPYRVAPFLPNTVDEAVNILISKLPLREKTNIARMKEDELNNLDTPWGNYIRDYFRLSSVNRELMESCRSLAGNNDLRHDDASVFIIHELWRELKKTHALRIVK